MRQIEYDVCFQKIREVFVKISLLDNNNKKIGEIQGVTLDGSINITTNSPIRRTCNLSLIVTDSSFLIGEDRKIWLDKRFKLEIGIKHLLTDEIVWFNKGIYAINQPKIHYNSTNKTLDLQGLDLMCNLDGTLSGSLEAKTIINSSIDITTAIKTTAQSLGDVTRLNIENINKTTPYDIEKQAGDSVYSVLEELKNLYMDWELFFNENGTLIFRKIKNYINDPTILDFNQNNQDLITDYTFNIDFENVRNKIIVYGRQLDNGIQIKSILENTDTNSPFNISKLGEKVLVETNDKLFEQDQADSQAEYKLFIHNNLNESVNIQCLPIYFLDVNKLVSFNLEEINLVGKYLITDITIPLSISSLMSFNAYKVY